MSNKKIEEKLLSFDERIAQTLEEKRELEIEESKKEKPEIIITDFKKVPSEYVLTDRTIFSVFNALTKMETEMTGSQISGLLGLNKAKRRSLKEKLISSLEVEDKYIKFHSYREA